MAVSLSIISEKEFGEVAMALHNRRTMARVAMKTANAAGSRLRWQFPEILLEHVQTNKSALQVKGRAAHASQTDPSYRLSWRLKIPVSQLKSGAKKLKGKRLVLHTGAGPRLFNAAIRKPWGFTLLQAGPLPQRPLGGVLFSRRRIISGSWFKRAFASATDEGVKKMEAEIQAALLKRYGA